MPAPSFTSAAAAATALPALASTPSSSFPTNARHPVAAFAAAPSSSLSVDAPSVANPIPATRPFDLHSPHSKSLPQSVSLCMERPSLPCSMLGRRIADSLHRNLSAVASSSFDRPLVNRSPSLPIDSALSRGNSSSCLEPLSPGPPMARSNSFSSGYRPTSPPLRSSANSPVERLPRFVRANNSQKDQIVKSLQNPKEELRPNKDPLSMRLEDAHISNSSPSIPVSFCANSDRSSTQSGSQDHGTASVNIRQSALKSLHSADDVLLASSVSKVMSRSRSPKPRPILKKNPSSLPPGSPPALGEERDISTSPVSENCPRAQNRNLYMSKSAPDLFATPDRVDGSERRYSRSSSRRDSVKSLCFDNVIKEVCLFSSDDSPARISQSPRYPESADEFSSPESEVEEIRFDNEYSFGQLTEDMDYDNKLKPVTKIYFPWTLISRTPKIPNQSPPIISIDSVRLSPSSTPTLVPAHTSNQPPPPQLLTFSIIVQNLAYVKNVAVRYTTDNWRTHFDVTASFVSSITRTTDSIVGLDRFDATIAVPTIPDKSSRDTWGTDCAPESDEQDFLAIELAARVKMNGIEAWDNNSGRNHGTVVMRIVRSVSGLMSAATAAAMIGSASMGLGGRSIGCGAAFRTIEEVVGAATRAAVKSAQAVAAEAEAIKRDFDLEWRRNSKSTFTNMLEHNSGNRRRSSFPGEKKRELATPKLPPAAIQEPPPPPVNKPMGFTLFDSACSVSESRASYRFPRSRNIQGTEESGPQYQNNDSPFYGWAPVTKYSGSPILGACEDASELFCDDEVADDKSFFGSAPLQQLKPHHQKCDVSQKSPINRSLSAPSTVFGSWRTPSTTTERRAALFSRRAASEFEDDSSEEENTWKSLPPKMVPRSHDVDDIVVKSLEGWNCWDD